MTLDEIREQIALKLNDEFNFWNEALSNTNPGNYGVDYFEVEANIENIYADIPNLKFSFKDVSLSFDLRLGASNEGGFNQGFLKFVNGKGEFRFEDKHNIMLSNLELETFLDLGE